MANSLLTNPIVIDTFTNAIDFSTIYDDPMEIESIEWSKPDLDDTAYVQSGGSSGPKIFDEIGMATGQSIFKRFNGTKMKPLYIPATAGILLASGTLIIVKKTT